MKIRQHVAELFRDIRANGRYALEQRQEALASGRKKRARTFLSDAILGPPLIVDIPAGGGTSHSLPDSTRERLSYVDRLGVLCSKSERVNIRQTLRQQPELFFTRICDAVARAEIDGYCLIFLTLWEESDFKGIPLDRLRFLFTGNRADLVEEGLSALIMAGIVELNRVEGRDHFQLLLSRYHLEERDLIFAARTTLELHNQDHYPALHRGSFQPECVCAESGTIKSEGLIFVNGLDRCVEEQLRRQTLVTPFEAALLGSMVLARMIFNLSFTNSTQAIYNNDNPMALLQDVAYLAATRGGSARARAAFAEALDFLNPIAERVGLGWRLAEVGQSSDPDYVLAKVERQTAIDGQQYLAIAPIVIPEREVGHGDPIYLGTPQPHLLYLGSPNIKAVNANRLALVGARELSFPYYCVQRLVAQPRFRDEMSRANVEILWRQFLSKIAGCMRHNLAVVGTNQPVTKTRNIALVTLQQILRDFSLFPSPGMPVSTSMFDYLATVADNPHNCWGLLEYVAQLLSELPSTRSLIVLPFLLSCIDEVDLAKGTVQVDAQRLSSLPQVLNNVLRGRDGGVFQQLKTAAPDLDIFNLLDAVGFFCRSAFESEMDYLSGLEEVDIAGYLEKVIFHCLVRSGLIDYQAIKTDLIAELVQHGYRAEVPITALGLGDRALRDDVTTNLVSFFVDSGDIRLGQKEGTVALSGQQISRLRLLAQEFRQTQLDLLPPNTGISWHNDCNGNMDPQRISAIADLGSNLNGASAAYRLEIDQESLERIAKLKSPYTVPLPGLGVGYQFAFGMLRRLRQAETLLVVVENGLLTLSTESEKLVEDDAWSAVQAGKRNGLSMWVSRVPLPKVLGKPVYYSTPEERLALEALVDHLGEHSFKGIKVSGLAVGVVNDWLCIPAHLLQGLTPEQAKEVALNVRLAKCDTVAAKKNLLLAEFRLEPRTSLIERMSALGKRELANRMQVITRIIRGIPTRQASVQVLLSNLLLDNGTTIAEERISQMRGGNLETQDLEELRQRRFSGVGAAFVRESIVAPSPTGVSFDFSALRSGNSLIYIYFSRGGQEGEYLFKASDGRRFTEHDVLERELRPLESSLQLDLGFIRQLGIRQARSVMTAVTEVMRIYDGEQLWSDSSWSMTESYSFRAEQQVRQIIAQTIAPHFADVSKTKIEHGLHSLFEALFEVDDITSGSAHDLAVYLEIVAQVGVGLHVKQLSLGQYKQFEQWLLGVEGWLQAGEEAERSKSGAKDGVVMVGSVFRNSAKQLTKLTTAQIVELVRYFKARRAENEKRATASVDQVKPDQATGSKARLAGVVKVAEQVRAEHDPLGALRARVDGAGNIFESAYPGAGQGVTEALLAAVEALRAYPDGGVLTPIRMLAEILHSLETGERMGEVRDFSPKESLAAMDRQGVVIFGFPWQYYTQRFWGRLIFRPRETPIGQARFGLNIYGGIKPSITEYAREERIETAGLRLDYDPRFRQPIVDIGGEGATGPLSEALSEVRTASWHFEGYMPSELNARDNFALFVRRIEARLRAKFLEV